MMKRKMKNVWVMALVVAALGCFGAVNAVAEEFVNVNFDSMEVGTVTEETLEEMGMSLDVNGTTDFSIVERENGAVSSGVIDKAKDGQKALRISNADLTEAGITTVTFPFVQENNYELNNDDLLYTEYEFFIESPVANSAKFGNINLIPFILRYGGSDGRLQLNYGTANSTSITDIVSRDGAYYYRAWARVQIVYDYENGTAETKIINITNNKVASTKVIPVESDEIQDLKFEVGGRDDTLKGKQYTGIVQLNNIKVYTVPKMKVTSLEPANDTYQVYPESREIKAVFTNTVDASSLENIVVCANSQVVSADKYTVSSAGNTVSILFNSDLEISTSYKIDYSAVTDESGLVISGDAVQTFRTEEWGAVNISSCKFIKNIGDSASETDSFTASELNGVLVTLNNTSEEKQSATIIYAVYSSEGRLTDTLISKNIVPASNSVTVTQGVKVENNGYIKLFIWDGMNTMRPWTGNILNYVN